MNITSKIVALSSAVAFALQIALALLMLRYFSPEDVGMFSVISQIGFFWTTLALAQTQLRLLANHGASVFEDARQAWVSSLQRFVWLSPVAALAVWWSGLSFVNALLWALLLSLCQLTWMLAQSMRLRMVGIWAQAGVRVLPPLMALLVAVGAVFMQWSGPALLAAALLGYAVGATWILPAFFSSCLNPQDLSPAPITPRSGDTRSAALRMTHTLADALLLTAIVVMWQRMYGEQETGWMSAALRVMGFVPAVVHMAWAQVLLAQPQDRHTNPLWIGLGGIIIVVLLGTTCEIAIELKWLDKNWQGISPYLLPLVLWQGCCCLTAAYSFRPFETKKAKIYTFACLGVSAIQINVLFFILLTESLANSYLHFYWFSNISSICFFIVFLWLRQLK